MAHEDLFAALKHPLARTDLDELGTKYEGKVRDCYTTRDGRRIIVVTDRISAFDRVLGTLPVKGQLLNYVASWWFEQTRDIVPNHLLETPDPNVMIAQECTPLPVEMVMRAYLTGSTSTSVWVHYKKGTRHYCGHKLPDGLREHEALPEPILTPSTKAAHGDHDVSASRSEILSMTHMSPADFDRAAELFQALFDYGQMVAAQRGLILVDTKYEFGKTQNGEIVVMDEIHTPDSSRYWFSATYDERFENGLAPESLDKEYVRRFLAAQGFVGDGPIPEIPDEVRVEASVRYRTLVEQLTGKKFQPNLEDPIPRIRLNLGLKRIS